MVHSPPMMSGEAWIWLLLAVAAVLAAGYSLNTLQRAAKRRARRARYLRAANESRPAPLSSVPAPLNRGMSPGQAAAIRAHAEKSAQKDWDAGHAERPNPYDPGTPEFVLWYATYQLRIGELADASEAEAERKRGNGRAS